MSGVQRKVLIVVSVFSTLTLLIFFAAYQLGRWSVRQELACAIETKLASVTPLENPPGAVENPDSEAPQSLPGLPEVTPEEAESVWSPLPEVMRPSTFSRFRATFEVVTKEPKEAEYAKRQTKELSNLVRSIPSVESVDILKIEGVAGPQEDARIFDLSD